MAAPTVTMTLTGIAAGEPTASREQFVGSINAALKVVNDKAEPLAAKVADAEAAISDLNAEVTRIGDLAFEAGSIYPTTAAGLAATTVGQQFRVVSTNPDIASYTYRNDAGGVATLIATTPSVAALATKANAADLAAADAIAKRADQVAIALAEALTVSQLIGAQAPVSGTNATASMQVVLAEPATGNGVVREAVIFAGVAGAVEIAVFSRTDAGVFTRLRYATISAALGVNRVPVGLMIEAGQYVGIRSDIAGLLRYTTQSNMGYYNGTLSGETFTDTSVTTGTQMEVGFTIDVVTARQSEAVITSRQTEAQTLGFVGNLTTGPGGVAGTLIPDRPALEDGVIDTVEILGNAGANVTISLFERHGDVMDRVAVLKQARLAANVVNLIRIDQPIKRGQFVGYQSADNGWAVTNAILNGNPYYYNASPVSESFAASVPFTSAAPQVRANITRVLAGAWHTVTLDNVDKVMAIGASYIGGYYNQRGKNWLSKVSLFSDYNFEQYALGGQSYASMLNNYIRPDDPIPPWGHNMRPSRYAPTYTIIQMGGNDAISPTHAVSFDAHAEDVRQMVETVRSTGAQPILSTEWQPFWDTASPSTHVIYKQIAEDMQVPFVDMIPHTLRVRDGAFYPGFWQGTPATNHPGVRTNHIIADEVERQLAWLPRPKNSIKIFRKRAGVTVGNIDDDLMFRDNYERAARFKELYLNQAALSVETENHYDDLSNTANYDQNSVVGSEYLKLRAGNGIEIADYALIDVIIDATLANVERFRLVLNDPGAMVWVRNALSSTNASSYPPDGRSVCRWTEVQGDGLGRFVIDGRDLAGKMHMDRLSFLVQKAGPWKLRAPSVEWIGNAGKPEIAGRPTDRASGASIVPQSTFDGSLTGWTATGTPTSSTIKETQFPAGIDRVVTLTSGQSLEQVLDYVPDPAHDREVEFVVTARRNPAVFAPSGDYGSAPVTQDSFDWTRVILELVDATGAFVMPSRKKVGLWWDDIVFRSIIPLRATPLTLRIRSESTIEIAEVTGRFVS